MSAGVYRSLLRLYPREFRGAYGDDLLLFFADLVAERGAPRAWARTGVDLIVTVPRYRMERIMSEQHSATAISVTIAVLATGAALSILTGFGPGALLLIAAALLAVAQRSNLARAIRTPDSNRRRRRLSTAAVLAGVFLASIVSYMLALSDDEISGASLVVHNAIGVPAMVGGIVFLVTGLLTPRTRDDEGRVTPVA